nr:hypothetical protein Q903MT_gene83 [Picea sitchensis]
MKRLATLRGMLLNLLINLASRLILLLAIRRRITILHRLVNVYTLQNWYT